MAFTAVAAVMEAGTAASMGTILAAAVEVGTAMTVVGAVTGNKDLMKVGGIIGMIGGVGGIVNNLASGAVEAGVSGMDMAADGGANSVTNAAESFGGNAAANEGIINSATTSPVTQSTVTPTDLPLANAAPPEVAPDPTAGMQAPASADTAAQTATQDSLTQGASQNVNANQGSYDIGANAPAGPADTAAPTTPANPATQDVNAVNSPAGASNPNAQSQFRTQEIASQNAQDGNSFWGSIKSTWNGFDNVTKSELVKGALSIPGGIQNAQFKNKQLAQQQAQIDYQNQGRANVSNQNKWKPQGGIIAGAR